MIALVVTYNGREACLRDTLLSLDRDLTGPITRRVVVDDTGEGFAPVTEWLAQDFYEYIKHQENQGMAASVQRGWAAALADPTVRFVCHWEDDMRLDRPLDLAPLARILETRYDLAQITLQRHPVNHLEADGQLQAIVDQSRESEVINNLFWGTYTTHDHLFSLNPCLIPRAVCEMGWPSGPIGVGNEDGFTAKCHAAGLKFATWGTVDDEPYITHTGNERAAAWQL